MWFLTFRFSYQNPQCISVISVYGTWTNHLILLGIDFFVSPNGFVSEKSEERMIIDLYIELAMRYIMHSCITFFCLT
jgi:hypothetical protein